MARVVLIFLSKKFAIQTKKLAFCMPFITTIKLNKSANVSQSMYEKYVTLGGTNKHENKAKITEIQKTVSFAKNEKHFFTSLSII